jgi:hypothetical protein
MRERRSRESVASSRVFQCFWWTVTINSGVIRRDASKYVHYYGFELLVVSADVAHKLSFQIWRQGNDR